VEEEEDELEEAWAHSEGDASERTVTCRSLPSALDRSSARSEEGGGASILDLVHGRLHRGIIRRSLSDMSRDSRGSSKGESERGEYHQQEAGNTSRSPHGSVFDAATGVWSNDNDGVDVVEDEIMEFSQSLREDVPQYLGKKMKMDERLFNKENNEAFGQGTERSVTSCSKKNKLALSVISRRYSSSGALLSSTSTGSASSSPRRTPSPARGLRQREDSTGSTKPLRGSSASSNSTTSQRLIIRHGGAGSSSSGSRDRNGNDNTTTTIYNNNNSGVRSGGSSNDNVEPEPSGLHWAEGCFHKVDMAAANQAYKPNKKRSRQNTLDTFIRQPKKTHQNIRFKLFVSTSVSALMN
jgi:hypothetical protein